MSADKWTRCPKCIKLAAQAAVDKREKADAAYGKVSLQEHRELTIAAEQAEKVKPFETLRHDYEIGVDSNGCFEVSYGCSCTNCDFEYVYNFKEKTDE
jgi:hypothetical protein